MDGVNDSYEDWIDIEKIRKGDKNAFGGIFKRHKLNVINLAYRFTRSQSAAEDIAQDIFLKIFEGKVPSDARAKFSTWLYRVTVNASIDHLRKNKLTPVSLDAHREESDGLKISLLEILEDPSAVSPSESLRQEEIRSRVQKEIDRLPEKFRSPVLLYQFEKLSYREIAGVLNITEKAVERRLYHAKEILRKNLGRLL